VIVGEVLLEVTAERALVLHDDVVETLAAQGADHAFHERILPGSTRRRQDFVDAHGLRHTRCAVHASVGCAVTLKWTMRRRSCESITKTNNTRNVTVGTVKKSTEASWET
jgi:hypothetical protein